MSECRPCLVAVDYPVRPALLTYLEGEWAGQLRAGMLVRVPLGKRMAKGIYWGNATSLGPLPPLDPQIHYRPIDSLLTDQLILSSSDLQLFEWVAKYYHYHLGQLIFDCLPSQMPTKEFVKFVHGKGEVPSWQLNSEQQKIADAILTPDFGQAFKRHYIYGVTGSGKTAIYLQLIQACLAKGQSVLVLVPEINLTPQLLDYFQRYLNPNSMIYPYHSELTPAYKWGVWRRLGRSSSPSEPCVVIGARSAVFLPLRNLGLIIMDEEHDTSYKQDDRCLYHAREVAHKKANLAKVPLVMGSATPSVESYHLHWQRQDLAFGHFEMSQRIGQVELPQIEVVPPPADFDDALWPLSPQIITAIEQQLQQQMQVIVFINKLGYAQYIKCRACAHQFKCKNCSTNLRYFHKKQLLVCQFCQYSMAVPKICPECGCMTLVQRGFGTERVQSVLASHFSQHVIERFDRDEVTTFKKLQQRLNDFHSGKIDLLVGTQMLAKGHNFEKVRLVVVLGTDALLSFPDFRAIERAYQTVMQITGRAGRFGRRGQVLLQTSSQEPQKNFYDLVTNFSMHRFFDEELSIRQICQFPPFAKIVIIYFSSKNQQQVSQVSQEHTQWLQNVAAKYYSGIEIMGPRPTLVEKRKNEYSWCSMVRSRDLNQLHNFLNYAEDNSPVLAGLILKLDVDPLSLW